MTNGGKNKGGCLCYELLVIKEYSHLGEMCDFFWEIME